MQRAIMPKETKQAFWENYESYQKMNLKFGEVSVPVVNRNGDTFDNPKRCEDILRTARVMMPISQASSFDAEFSLLREMIRERDPERYWEYYY